MYIKMNLWIFFRKAEQIFGHHRYGGWRDPNVQGGRLTGFNDLLFG